MGLFGVRILRCTLWLWVSSFQFQEKRFLALPFLVFFSVPLLCFSSSRLLLSMLNLRCLLPTCDIFSYIFLMSFLIIYFWLCWAFAAAGFSSAAASRGYSPVWVRGLLAAARAPVHEGFASSGTGLSDCGSWALGGRLNSCAAQA